MNEAGDDPKPLKRGDEGDNNRDEILDAVQAPEDTPSPNPSPRKSHTIRISGSAAERVVPEQPPVRASTTPGIQKTTEPPSNPITSQPDPPSGERKIRPDLRQDELVRGARPGDRYIRQSRDAGQFRRRGGGVLAASLETDLPRSAWGRIWYGIRRGLIGRPISNEQSIHERLTNVKALAVLSSDALSSVAYATEEILRVLILATAVGALGYTLPLGFAVILLLSIVAISYRQTIAAYPRGGGSYIVAKDNLGTLPGLTAAASILIDYTMTVAVSTSAGVAAIYSLFPGLRDIRVEICIGIVILVTLANLRGVREAGSIFAIPTYLFVLGILGMIVFGLLRTYLGVGGEPVYVPPSDVLPQGAEGITLFLLLRAFTQGCTALTGVEAIADGVPAFKPPEAKNARTTLLWMAILAVTMFGGITLLASKISIQPSDKETVLSQLARTIFPSFGDTNPLWYFINIATALILVLAANTAFSDFPRLAYFLARDKFMPHQYSFRGDKLAFSWGIVTLAILASVLIIAFDGDTTALIPLYTVGVFASFTLSQSGMVRKWWKTRTPGWRSSLTINLLGALATAIVLVISAVTKFALGAWIVLVLVPIIITMFLAINRHYRRVSLEVSELQGVLHPMPYNHTFIVPVSSLNAVTRTALNYARSLNANVYAVHIVEGEDPEEAELFTAKWREMLPNTDINLVIIESPYRSLIGPLLSYIDALDKQSPDDTVTIVLPEFLPAKPWEYLLHNQSALRLKAALLFRKNTVVADVPYMLGSSRAADGQLRRRSIMGTIPWGAIIVLLAVIYLAYSIFFKR